MPQQDQNYLDNRIDEVSESVVAGDNAVRDYAAGVSVSVDDLRTDLGTEVVARAKGDVDNRTHTDQVKLDGLSNIVELRTELGDKAYNLQLGIDQNDINIADLATQMGMVRDELLRSIQLLDIAHQDELALMDERIKKYEQMLSDITVDNNQIHVNDGNVIAGAWTILSQARVWDLDILNKLGKVEGDLTDKIDKEIDQIKDDIPLTEDIIKDLIENLGDAPVIKDLDEKLNNLDTEMKENAQAIIDESLARQDEMLKQAVETAEELKRISDENINRLEQETQERIDEITRQADITQKEIDAETKKLRDDLQAQIDAIDTDLIVDLSDLYERVDKADQAIVDAKAAAKADNVALGKRADALKQDIDAEEQARIADILLLNDGLTKEINNRVDGDKKSIAAIENYKSSNDTALANVRTEISALVTEQTAQAKRVDALDVRLKANETETGKAMDAAASAVTKAEAAVTATEAMASEITSVKASLESTDKKVAANTSAISGLSTKVSNVEGKLSTAISDITALEADMVLADKGIKANSKAIEELRVVQEQHGEDITLINQKITSLSSDLDLVEKDLATKVSSTAFESLKTTVTKQGENITSLTNRTTLLESDLETVKGDLSKKANSSALEELSTKVTNIDGRVTANASKILGLESSLKDTNSKVDKKLDASVIQQYSTTVQTNKAIADSITAYDTSLLIGSTNLLFGTGIREGFNSYNSKLTWLKEEGNPTDTVRIDYTTNSAMGIATAMPYRRMKLIKGRKYIVSFLGQGTIANLNYMYIMRPEGGNVHIGTMKLGSGGNIQRTLEFTWNEETASNFGILIATRAGVSGTWFSVRSLMIEEGTKATTTWKPNAIEQAEYMDATAKAVQQVTASVEEVEKGVAANASAITALNTKVTKVEGDLKNTATAESVQQLKNQVTAIDGRVTSNSSAITKLTNDLSSTNTELSKKASTAALNALKSDVTAIDGKVTANTTSITDLKSTVEQQGKDLKTKASAAALTALTSTVTAQGKDIESISNSMTDLSNQVTIIDNERKIMDTRSKVEQPAYYWKTYPKRVVYEFKTASLLGLTGMGTLVVLRTETPWKDPSGGTILQTVYSEDGTLDANRASRGTGKDPATFTWTAFTQPMKSALEKIEANSKATESLSSKVTANEKAITAASSKLTKLESDISVVKGDLEKKADASALTTLQTKVTNIDGRVTSNTSAITTLKGRVDTNEGNIKKKADTSVLVNYSTKTETDKAIADGIAAYDSSLVIGGSNLLWGTQSRSGFQLYGGKMKWYNDTQPTEMVRVDYTSSNVIGVVTADESRLTHLIKGRTYTLSFLGQSTLPTLNYCYVMVAGGNFKIPTVSVGSGGSIQRSVTFEWTNDTTEIAGILIGANNAVTGTWFSMRSLMLEESTKPSRVWSPNPKEINDSIRANSKAIQLVTARTEKTEKGIETLTASTTSLKSELDTTKATVDKKNKTYRRTTAPLNNVANGLKTGDGWYNTTAGQNNRLSIWDGSKWVDSSDPRVATLTDQMKTKADASALTGLETKVTKQGNDITALSTAQTKLEGRVSTAETNISKKAEASAVNQLINDVKIIDGKVTTNTSSITSLQGRTKVVEDGLKKKADASALDSIYNKTQTDAAIAGSITDLKASIEISGSNLLFGTGDIDGFIHWGSASSTIRRYKKNRKSAFGYMTPYYLVTSQSDGSESMGVATATKYRETVLAAGKTYTLSWKGQGSVSTMDYIYILSDTDDNMILPTVLLTNKGGQSNNSVTFKMARTISVSGVIIGSRRFKTGQWFTVANVTLNETEFFTEWSPNATEMEDNVSGNATAISNLEVSVKDIDGAVDAISKSITALEATNQALNKDNLLEPKKGISLIGADYGRGSYPLTAPITFKTGDVYTVRAKITVKHNGSLTSSQGFAVYLDGADLFGPTIQKADEEIVEFKYTVPADKNGLTRTVLRTYFRTSGIAKADTETTVHWIELYKGATPVDDLATAKAVTSLEARVKTAEGKITSTSSAVTALQNTVNDSKTGVKATANAVTLLTTRVEKTEKGLETQSNAITSIESGIDGITTINNTRNDNFPPSHYWTKYKSKRVREFKLLSTLGMKADKYFPMTTAVLESDIPWGDPSGGPIKQTLLAEDMAYSKYRYSKSETVWGPWSQPVAVVNEDDMLTGVTINDYTKGTAYERHRFNFDKNITLKTGDTYTVRFKASVKHTGALTNVQGLLVYFDAGPQLTSTRVHQGDDQYFEFPYTVSSDRNGQVRTSLRFFFVSAGTATATTETTIHWVQLVKGTTNTAASAAAMSILTTKVTSIDGKVSAHAKSLTDLTTTVEGNTATLQLQGEVVDGLSASYVMRADVNGLITSAGLYNDGKQTAFGVNADYFYVGRGTTKKKAFIVTTTGQVVNGVTYPAGVWMDVATIANATIGTAKIADLAVTNAKIANLAITNAKIADATIENAKIKNLDAAKITTGYLNANRINAKSITASKLNITELSAITANLGTAIVKNANIENGAITSAKIGNAQVDTLQVAGGAITANVMSRAASSFSIPSYDTWYTISSATINTAGGNVIASFSFAELHAQGNWTNSISASVQLRIKRGSTVISSVLFVADTKMRYTIKAEDTQGYEVRLEYLVDKVGAAYEMVLPSIREKNYIMLPILDSPPSGNQTYSVDVYIGGFGSSPRATITDRRLVLQGAKR